MNVNGSVDRIDRSMCVTCKDHFCSWNVLLRIGEIDVEGLLLPGDALVLVGLGVAEPRRLPCFTTDQTPQIGTCIHNVDVMICCEAGLILISYLVCAFLPVPQCGTGHTP